MPVRDWLRTNPLALAVRLTDHPNKAMSRFFVRAATFFTAWLHRKDLNYLAMLFGTDKWGQHWYTQHYQGVFAPLRKSRLHILEIGVGGYSDPSIGACSLRMWKAYFRRGRIVGIDICDKSRLVEGRIDIRQCSQTDADALRRLSDEYGGFDIVIDDGSHVNAHVIRTFEILFPLLRDNGIYAIEDTQTAYWQEWGGGIGRPESSMSFLKSLVDGLNHAEYPIPNYHPSYFDKHIVEITFFHNLALIRKALNDEGTNCPGYVEREIRIMTKL
jgi:hypothetical protein